MRCIVAVAFMTAPCAARLVRDDTMVNDPKHIERLNGFPESLWLAAPQERFEGMTFGDVRALLGTRLSHISQHLNETRPESAYAAMSNERLPDILDARKKWKGLIHPIRDQQQCGSCWAFSSSEALSDRVAIATGRLSPVLSPEDMVSCDRQDDGCQGGQLSHAWKYLSETGIVTDSCMPYTAGGGLAPECPSTCVDSESFVRTKAESAYAINGVINMQKDMMMHGPIQVGFQVYGSFMSYRKGIYHKHKEETQPEGGHAVKMVGWGRTAKKGIKYWVVANSWSPTWGEEGFFRIRRGHDECGIETMGPPYAGLPAVPSEDLLVV